MWQASYLSSRKTESGRRLSYALSFFGPVLILLLILAASGVFPLGEECFLRTDMYHQYAPFFEEFREKLRTGGSLLYSWDVGLGVNFTALYAYYLASPLNWLVALVSGSYVIEFMMALVVVKIGLCGLCMNFYLRRRSQSPDAGTAFFAIFYALSGYVCAYYWNIMWLDCIVLFPLIMYGMESLLFEKRGILYAGVLGVCILSNYYISIMICLFLILYFFALNVLEPPKRVSEFFGRGFRFAFYSLLAGGLSAVLLLPELWALRQTASADFTFPQTFTQYFSIIDMFARHMPGVETEQALDHWPNLYCGTAVFVLFGLYLIARRIRLKEKAVYVTLLLFFLLSFSVNVLNFIWHGFHYPNSLPARQSFIYCFLMLFICYRAYEQRDSFTGKQIGGVFLAAAGFIFLAQKTVTAKHFHFAVFYAALLFAAVYALLLWLRQSRRLRARLLFFLALGTVLVEAAVNTALTSITTTSRTAYTKDNEDIRTLARDLYPSTEFFRAERIDQKTKNDGAWLTFPSVSLFSSLANADCSDFFQTIGCEASTNAYSITGSTPLVNMLFSVRYGFYQGAQEEDAGKSLLAHRGNTYLYRNRYSLPLGFVLPEEVENSWMLELDDPALVQNALCDVLGVSPVLVPNQELGSEEGDDYAVTISEDGEYYAVVKNAQVRDITVSWSDRKKTIEHIDRGFLIELGDCRAGDLIRMHSETAGEAPNVDVYRFDYDALGEVYAALSEQPLKLSRWEDDRLSGQVSIDPEAAGYASGQEAALYFSIPYDEGWEVRVDGVPAETKKIWNTFLGVDLPAGAHEIELRFMPKGLLPGAAISLASLVLLLLAAGIGACSRRRRALNTEHAETAEAEAAENEPEETDELEELEDLSEEDATDESGDAEALDGGGPDEPRSGAEEPEQPEQKAAWTEAEEKRADKSQFPGAQPASSVLERLTRRQDLPQKTETRGGMKYNQKDSTQFAQSETLLREEKPDSVSQRSERSKDTPKTPLNEAKPDRDEQNPQTPEAEKNHMAEEGLGGSASFNELHEIDRLVEELNAIHRPK